MDILDKATIEALKEIFVTRHECDEKNDAVQESIHSVDKRLGIIEKLQEQQDKKANAIFAAVVSNIAALIVSALVLAFKMGAI